MKNNLYVALKDNQLIDIESVPSGLRCGCVCPYCHEKLIAKKGKKRQHHFAHYSGDSCQYGYQTSLHLMAKEIISELKTFSIPKVYLNALNKNEKISDSMNIQIQEVYLEHKIDDIIPDIILKTSNGQSLLVEIYVTHSIDQQKLEKIKKLNISTIQIDLSKIDRLITKEELIGFLNSDNSNKQWIYNSCVEKYYKYFLNLAQKYKIVVHGFASHIMNCPLHKRIWHGRYYANLLDDCFECEYLLEYTNNYNNFEEHKEKLTEDYILCLGHVHISSIQDLKKYYKK